jgi:hypothetical protein
MEVDMKLCKFFVIIVLFSLLLWADWEVRYTTIGQWELTLSNYGQFGHSNGSAGGFWPRGTGHNYIYGAGFDVGAIKPNGDTIVTIGYGPHGQEAEYTPGIPYSDFSDPQWQLYFSTDDDYPFIPVSFQDGYAIYNDFDSMYHMPDSFLVLGITVTQKTYVWPIEWADDVVFLKYIIKNDTTYTLDNVYAGICMDFDIGNETGSAVNDRCGLDLGRKMFYGWQEEEEPLWDWHGMLGLKLLSPYPLSSFKRFDLTYEPDRDREWYLTMAGYNFQTGVYEPYDSIWPPPDDQRIMIASGPFDSLAPGDSVIVDWVLIGSRDTLPPCPELTYKADKAQACFDAGWHDVHVIDPNGGEVVSGTYTIHYSATSVTPSPLKINFYIMSETNIDTIIIGQNNTGGYNWNTTLWPDGVFNKIIIAAHNTITFGYDISDYYFSIDNPGNAPPGLQIFSPADSETLSGSYGIEWFTRDPEFQDSLFINIYFQSQYDTTFQIIASNELNDSIYTWNTYPYRNGSGLLIVETHDEEYTVAETVEVFLLNEIPSGEVNHLSGLNNTVNISALLHQPSQITGHTYELEFLQYRGLLNDIFYYPEYIYEIRDSNIGVTVLDTYSLKNGYTFGGSILRINDFSPIIDGFSISAYTENGNIISSGNFHNDSVRIVSGSYPEDSLFLLGTNPYMWWAYRGSRLQLDWVNGITGGLTLFVTDLDYGDTIPYKPYGPGSGQNSDSAFGWCFRSYPGSGGTPSDTLRDTDKYIFLCGDRIRFSRNIPPPQVGDSWIVYPSEYSPPIKGNKYCFTPTGINETRNQVLPMTFQVYPVPFTKNLTIAYSIPNTQKIKIVIYDVLGRKVCTLKDGLENPGFYKIIWSGVDDMDRKVSSGIYFCRFVAESYLREIKDNYRETEKFILLK